MGWWAGSSWATRTLGPRGRSTSCRTPRRVRPCRAWKRSWPTGWCGVELVVSSDGGGRVGRHERVPAQEGAGVQTRRTTVALLIAGCLAYVVAQDAPAVLA